MSDINYLVTYLHKNSDINIYDRIKILIVDNVKFNRVQKVSHARIFILVCAFVKYLFILDSAVTSARLTLQITFEWPTVHAIVGSLSNVLMLRGN